MHQIYGAESDRLNATFEINDSEPEVEFLNRAGLRALPDELGETFDPYVTSSFANNNKNFRELRLTTQLAQLTPIDDPDISTRALEMLEEFYKARGMPNEAEEEMLMRFGGLSSKTLKDWCK